MAVLLQWRGGKVVGGQERVGGREEEGVEGQEESWSGSWRGKEEAGCCGGDVPWCLKECDPEDEGEQEEAVEKEKEG